MPGRDPKGPLIMAATAIYTQSLVEGLLAEVGKSEKLSHLMSGRDAKDPLIMAVTVVLNWEPEFGYLGPKLVSGYMDTTICPSLIFI